MKIYYILVKSSAVFVKAASFFKEQGGLTKEWGKNWEPIEAENAYDAHNKAVKLRRERFPNSHKTLGEDEPIELVWPEARGV